MPDNGDRDDGWGQIANRTRRYIRPNIDVEFGVIQYEIVRIARDLHQIGWLAESGFKHLDAGIGFLLERLERLQAALDRIADELERATVVRYHHQTTVDQDGDLGEGHHGQGETIYTATQRTRVDKFTVVADPGDPDEPVTEGSVWIYRDDPDPVNVELFLPVNSTIAPVIIVDPDIHLQPGERLTITGEDLPPHLDMHFNLLLSERHASSHP